MDNGGDLRHIEFATFGETVISPIIILIVLLMGFFIMFTDRKYMIVPLLIVACYVPFVQRIVIGGFDIDMMRLTIFFGLCRLIIRKEPLNLLSINNMDWVFYIYVIVNVVMYMIQYKTSSAFVNRLGFMINAFGSYWLIRFAVQDFDDLKVLIKSMIIISIPIAITMISEQLTGGHNWFSVFGGVSAQSMIRDGRVRAQGAFSHPILAGTFGSVLSALTVAYYRISPENRRLGIIGMISALVIIICSASSGPLLAFMAGMVASYMFKYRKDMKTARGLIWFSIFVLAVIFDGKPHEIIWRVGVVGGSTGYHRFMLIDAAITNFLEWAPVGIHSTGHWGWGLNDITNMYILEGVRGGILRLIFFCYSIMLCYKATGNIRKRQDELGKLDYSALIWGLGVVMFSHNVSFISVAYFGNMMFFYYMVLAAISSLQDCTFGPKNSGEEYTKKKI